MNKATWLGAFLCLAVAALIVLGGCGKDKAGIVRAKMPDRFHDLVETDLPATVGVTAVAYIDLASDQSIRLANFLREHEVFKKVRLVQSPAAAGCDVVVGGVLEKQGRELYAMFRIYQGGRQIGTHTFRIPWNPKGAGKGDEKEVAGVYLSFRGVWSRLAIHLVDDVLKIGPK